MGLDFKNKLFLAPMANITSSCFRLECRKYGADVVCTELISASAIVRENDRSKKLLEFSKGEKPIGVQLFGGNTDEIIKSAKIVSEKFDFVDFNLGCPAAKVLSQGAGASLLKRKNKVEEILRGLVKACDENNKPATIKIRSGVDDKHLNYLEIAKIAENCGVSAITLHARTVKQGYSGKANWEWIKKLKENINILVIGNGDVVDGKSCKEIYDFTKCDSVMIGRAAIGYPFIFREIKYYLENQKDLEKATIGNRLKSYLDISKKMDFQEAKMHALWYISGIKGSSQIRNEISRFKNYQQIEKCFNKIIDIKSK